MYSTFYNFISHSLNIEKVRYNDVISQMFCNMCNQNDTEDKFHFILKCQFYEELEMKYIKHCYNVKAYV